MKLFWTPQTRAQRGIWMLEEAGVDYAMERIDLGSDESRATPGFLEASPMGKVPALVDGDVAMADNGPAQFGGERFDVGLIPLAIDKVERANGSFLEGPPVAQVGRDVAPGIVKPAVKADLLKPLMALLPDAGGLNPGIIVHQFDAGHFQLRPVAGMCGVIVKGALLFLKPGEIVRAFEGQE